MAVDDDGNCKGPRDVVEVDVDGAAQEVQVLRWIERVSERVLIPCRNLVYARGKFVLRERIEVCDSDSRPGWFLFWILWFICVYINDFHFEVVLW